MGMRMVSRIGVVLLFAAAWAHSAAAQVVRFETTIGDFDMVLNPTNDTFLEEYAENMVRYVEDERYKASWINRAAENFVLQMGGFYSHTRRPPITIDSTRQLSTFDPVLGFPASFTGLSNTVGTVSLALPGDGMGGTNQDAGTSSFFINLASNTFLDADFTVFAMIPDMTVVNQIMALMQVDKTADPQFGAGAGNLAFSDIPLTADGHQVFIKRAFVIDDAMSVARAMAGIAPIMASSAAVLNGGPNAAVNAGSAVPEPGAITLLLCGLAIIFCVTARSAAAPARGCPRSR
jgi:cyclophilin family peptidyl-prolyl cis-trans isomerase